MQIDGPTGATVLVVDDEPDVRAVVRALLRRHRGFEVVAEATNGREGVDLAADLQPDVVLLDLIMPEMDGRQALPRIVTESPRSMVVVLSALSVEDEAGPALAAGAFAYLPKSELKVAMVQELSDLLATFRRALNGETVLGSVELAASGPAPAFGDGA